MNGGDQKGIQVAKLIFRGKLSPLACIVAETPEEAQYIRESDKEISRGTVDGRDAFILSATVLLDTLNDLQREVSLGSRKNIVFPGRVLSIPRLSETSV